MKITWGGTYWWKHGKPTHGPQVWPWWKIVSFSVVELQCYDHTHLGWCLWVYTKWGSQSFYYYAGDDLLWQHILDRNDMFRHQVFEGVISREDYK